MRRLLAAFAAAAVTALAVAVLPSADAATTAPHARTVVVWLSTYDLWNNSPPGYGIEYAKSFGYPTVHGHACCRAGGTYGNPVTFAAPRSWLRPGTRIYIGAPFRRYFILEDLCSSCTIGPQADLWVGGVSRGQNASGDPHNIVNLFRRQAVIVDPPRGLPVRGGLLAATRI